MKTRFSNTKSHFKKERESCEIVKHLIDHEHIDVDTSSIKTYDVSISKLLWLKRSKLMTMILKLRRKLSVRLEKDTCRHSWKPDIPLVASMKETNESTYPLEIKEKAEADSAIPISNLYLFY